MPMKGQTQLSNIVMYTCDVKIYFLQINIHTFQVKSIGKFLDKVNLIQG